MLFPTLDFLLFLLVVLTLLTLCGENHARRKLLLCAASYYFYAQWNWRYCVLLAGSSVLTWLGGVALGAATAQRSRKAIVGVFVGLHLAILATFKYFDFFVGTTNHALSMLGFHFELPFIEIVLPVGISFFTFHGISYLVDVYRGDVARCRRLSDILLYLSFFPQLVAGPIVRAAFFLPQLDRDFVERVSIAEPILLILGGLIKKVIIANYIATDLVDPVFFDPSRYGSLDLLLAVYGYAVQIFCDFSAYSDMAIGIAALLGYRFPQNFDQPYRSASLQEFWRRWHMTLSFWLRDYLYKPLGGSRGGNLFTIRNLMITMLLGGLWHGADWKFIAWGALHGTGLVLERLLRQRFGDRTLSPPARLAATLGIFHYVCLGWLLFRADSFGAVVDYLTAMLHPETFAITASPLCLALIALGLSLHGIKPNMQKTLARRFGGWPLWAWSGVLAGGVLAIDALGPEGVAPFIYFQF